MFLIPSLISFPFTMPWPSLYGRPFTCMRLHLLWLPPRSHLLYCQCSFSLLPLGLQHISTRCRRLVFQCFVKPEILSEFRYNSTPQLENRMSVASCQALVQGVEHCLRSDGVLLCWMSHRNIKRNQLRSQQSPMVPDSSGQTTIWKHKPRFPGLIVG